MKKPEESKKRTLFKFKLWKLLLTVGTLLVMAGILYVTKCTLNPSFFTGALFYVCVIFAVLGLIFVWVRDTDNWTSYDGHEIDNTEERVNGILLIICGVIIVSMAGVAVAGSALFQSELKYKQIGDFETISYQEMVERVDTSQIPIVDANQAEKMANKRIGEEPALGSKMALGEGAVQEVNGKIQWVFPLEFTGFFKWNSSRVSPGYITVSASNMNDVKFVKTTPDGESIQMKYLEKGYFDYNLKRHMRMHGFLNVGLTEYTFEVSDDGYPYWVTTYYHNAKLWGSPEADGVVIVDAQTGEIASYAIDEIPDWVDIVQPEKFIGCQIDNWGTLPHGPFNFSKTDEYRRTPELLTVFLGGDCYYFTGITSVGNDNSCIGFVMINTRSKDAKIAYMAGATEDAAMKSAEGLVANYGYTSTEPVPINVNGYPTYAMALKDAEGLSKAYAMINIEDYSIGGFGDSLAEAQKDYMGKMAKSGKTYNASDNAEAHEAEGVIWRISSEVIEGTTQYYFILEDNHNSIFTVAAGVSEELAITEVGDTVSFSYIDDNGAPFDVIEFENIKFMQPASSAQQSKPN